MKKRSRWDIENQIIFDLIIISVLCVIHLARRLYMFGKYYWRKQRGYVKQSWKGRGFLKSIHLVLVWNFQNFSKTSLTLIWFSCTWGWEGGDGV
jgi:hypothetical protein